MQSEDTASFFDLDLSKFKTFTQNEFDYLYFYCPGHPLARQNGTVAVHRHKMSVHLGRWLEPDEMIYFVDRNPRNVSLENLRAVSRAEFFRLTVRPDGIEPKAELLCHQCKKPFIVVASQRDRRHHCSRECLTITQTRFRVSAKELHDWVWSMPTTHVAAELGVSDKAIEKRCKKLGVTKPPRGYWAQVYAGKIDPIANKPPFNGSKDSSLSLM